MQKSGEYNHSENNVAKALGIKKTEDELNEILITKVVHDMTVTSGYLGRIIAVSDTPEEIAYQAYKLGYSAAGLEGEDDEYDGFFAND
jgi:hypothetical protein